jgi:serine/threonine-protein kinase
MQIDELGPYRIGRKLGRGGMGTVYEGVHVETGEPAAVKLLSESLVHEPDFRHRFEAEIEALRKLNHPHIVRLFGFGQQGDHLFYAMELVAGSSLETELGRGRIFPWREALRIGIQLAQALRHAHDRGVIHRDIKPGNLLLTAEGEVKLSDFGIARLFGSRGHTMAGSVLGTAEFMSPEQAEGRAVSPRSDLYSLGGVLYVLLTRRPPFRGKSLPEILLKQRMEEPLPVGELVPDVPAELQQVIAQLLAKDPERRIPTAAALVRRLEAIDREMPAAAAGVPAPAAPLAPAAVPPAEELPSTVVTENVPPPAPPAPPVSPGGGSGVEPAETAIVAAVPPLAEAPPPAATVKPAGRFTPVGKEELDQAESVPRTPSSISLQTVGLAAGLAAIVGAIIFFLQPPGADDLYKRIQSEARRNDPEALRLASEDIEAFVHRFPGDRRCPRLRGRLRDYRQEIELDRLQRKFDLRTRGVGAAESLLPVEQACFDALNDARLDPDRGMVKLQALIDLYGDHAKGSDQAALCLELAAQKLARLKVESEARADRQLKVLSSRLDEADRLRETDPRRAKTMYRALIELYGQKPWAAPAVRRARDSLANFDDKQEDHHRDTERN